MIWRESWKADPVGAAIADRHYNRHAVGSAQFVPPGRAVVLVAEGSLPERGALWITSWPFEEYVKHEWAGAWVNSAFRNEMQPDVLSSEAIRDAVAASLAVWPDPPEPGLVTFINPRHVRRKRDLGRCYRRAGFVEAGRTKDLGLVALRLDPADFPPPEPALVLGRSDALALARGQGTLVW